MRPQEEMLREAEALVAERRTPEVAAVRTEQGREGVFAWAGGPPRAGETAVLAYNKACGALRCAYLIPRMIRSTDSVGAQRRHHGCPHSV